MPCRIVLCLGLALLLSACGREPPSVAAPQGSLTILLDGEAIGVLEAAALRPRVLLQEAVEPPLPAPPTWLVLEGRAKNRLLRVLDPATRYKEQDVYLYLDAEGRPAVGIFRRDRPELTEQTRRLIREPTIALVQAESVHIRTQPEPEKTTAGPSLLVVTTGEEPRPLRAEALRALPLADLLHEGGQEKRRGASKRSKKGGGYHLADALALVETRPIASVRLIAADGTELVLEASALQERTAPLPLLKLNRRGQFQFRSSGGGADGAGPAPQLRGLERIVITLAE
jgi:hypothetical protein